MSRPKYPAIKDGMAQELTADEMAPPRYRATRPRQLAAEQAEEIDRLREENERLRNAIKAHKRGQQEYGTGASYCDKELWREVE